MTLTTDDAGTDLDGKLALNDGSAANEDQSITLAQFYDALILSGDTEITHTVTVTYEVFSDHEDNSVITVTDTFPITIKNPCINKNFVTIVTPNGPLSDETYVIDSAAKTWTPYSTGAWSVATTPVTHTLCGGLTITPQYEGFDLIGGEPITHTSGTDALTVESTDGDLIGETKAYSLVATLTNYPVGTYATADTETLSGTIQFLNPCDNPFTFTVPAQQTTGLSDNFSGTAIDWTLTEFPITPSRCIINYSCTGVVEAGEASSTIGCGDLPFDGIFDNIANVDANLADGELTFTADPADYGTYRPGSYTVTIKGAVEGVTDVPGTTSQTTTLTIVLTDPCDPPASLVVANPAAVDMDYTLTQAE